MTVRITRMELDASGLRAEAARSGDAKMVRRLLALALVLEGCDRTQAARQCGMDRQTLRDWVIRYNAEGVPGLSDRPHAGGPTAKLTEMEGAQRARWVREGPDRAEDGVVRGRLRDLRARILARFFVVLDERSVGRMLNGMGFSHVSVRPRHPQADPEAQAAHKKTSPSWSQPRSHPRHGANPWNSGGRMKPASASKAA